MKLLDEATKKEGQPISTWTLLIDLEGLNMRHMWRPGIGALLRIIEIVEANYPETMGEWLIVRTPRVFPILWTVVSTFIDSNTKRKILVYSGHEYLNQEYGLVKYIADELIPTFLGGQCQSPIPNDGGLIPKSLYMSNSWLDKEQSIYQSFNLSKGQVFEKYIMNQDPGSVLTWDFDVISHDVSFTVFRTNHPIHLKETTNCSGSSSTSCNHNSGGTNALQQHKIDYNNENCNQSVIEKSWVENCDYYKVADTVMYRDGESVQGSHVMENCGSYILQWKFVCDHHVDLIDSIIHHKTKIMFFYEVLASANYKYAFYVPFFKMKIAIT